MEWDDFKTGRRRRESTDSADPATTTLQSESESIMAKSIARRAVATAMVLVMGGCASIQKQSPQTVAGPDRVSTISNSAPIREQGGNLGRRDPLEPFNQSMFIFNRKLDDWLLRPVASGYVYVLPQPARSSVSRFFVNVDVVPRFANDLFQGNFNQASVEVARFGINSTIGVAGLFDPAGEWLGLQQKPNDFGLTLAKYGIDEGPYLVLPLFGPSTVRDAIGKVADMQMNPVNYLVPNGALPYELAARALSILNDRSAKLDTFYGVARDSVDPYGAVQDTYLRRRLQEENRVREE